MLLTASTMFVDRGPELSSRGESQRDWQDSQTPKQPTAVQTNRVIIDAMIHAEERVGLTRF